MRFSRNYLAMKAYSRNEIKPQMFFQQGESVKYFLDSLDRIGQLVRFASSMMPSSLPPQKSSILISELERPVNVYYCLNSVRVHMYGMAMRPVKTPEPAFNEPYRITVFLVGGGGEEVSLLLLSENRGEPQR